MWSHQYENVGGWSLENFYNCNEILFMYMYGHSTTMHLRLLEIFVIILSTTQLGDTKCFPIAMSLLGSLLSNKLNICFEQTNAANAELANSRYILGYYLSLPTMIYWK